MKREDVKILVKKWWDIYNDDSLDYKPPVSVAASASAASGPVNLLAWAVSGTEEASLHQLTSTPSAA